MFHETRHSSFLFILQAYSICFGQGTPVGNPFDLEYRIKEARAQLGTTTDSISSITAVVNPFDVVAHKAPAQTQKKQVKKTTTGLGGVTLRPQSSTRKPFVLITIGIILGFLALTFAVRRSVAIKTWAAFFSDNFLNQAQRDYSGMIGAAPFFMLYVHFFANAGLFSFLFIKSLTGDQFNSFWFLLACMGGIASFFLLKHLVVTLAGWLFESGDEASRYNFLILVFSCVMGLFLLPANLFLALREGNTSFLPFWVAAMVAVFYLFRFVRSISLFGSYIAKNFFHFLLYLCVIEIIPFALLIKVIMGGIA